MRIIRCYQRLCYLINFHNNLYFKLGQPIISDYRYDCIYNFLTEFETSYRYLLKNRLKVSPISNLNSHNSSAKFAHKLPMLSIQKAKNVSQLVNFISKIPGQELNIELKLDGVSISLIYHSGKLTRALTRGNGYYGTDVTSIVKHIKDCIPTLNDPLNVIVRGEIMMTYQTAKDYHYPNPRNGVAGLVMTLSSKGKETILQQLKFFAYSIYDYNDSYSQEDNLNTLKKWGFTTVEYQAGITDINQLLRQYDVFYRQLSQLNYPCDGIVCKVNNLKLHHQLGFTATHPKGIIAYKFPYHDFITTINHIDWKIGRTGILTPVATINPVVIEGSIITKVSLSSYSYVTNNLIGINTTIMIKKSGGVIPAISKIIKVEGYQNLVDCPYCYHQLMVIGKHLYCLNDKCNECNLQKIIYAVSKDCLDIEELGSKTCRILYDKLIITTLPDIFYLTAKDLLNIPGFQEKKSQNIIESIKKARSKSLSQFISALGIEGVGKVLSLNIANKITSLTDLLNLDLNSLAKVGPETVKSFQAFINNHHNTIKALDLLIT